MKPARIRYSLRATLLERKMGVKLCLAGVGLWLVFLINYLFGLYGDGTERTCFNVASTKNPKRSHYNISLMNRLEPDIDKLISQLIAGLEPDLPPINRYDHPYIIPNVEKCLSIEGCRLNIRLLIIVKSAIGNFERRNVIRQTWGWEQRFPGVVVRCVFNLGTAKDNSSLQQQVEKEQSEHGDIIQGNFIDVYKNNTIKTMMGFRWVVEKCSSAKFIMFVDDDMYVSTKNALQYANRPDNYPKYLQTNNSQDVILQGNIHPFQFDLNAPPASFFAGHAKYNDPPYRTGSKWKVSFSEYPFPVYPPYVSAGVFILSFQSLRKMYYTSMYTPHFPYDDVYLGMVAKRAGIIPLDNENFVIDKRPGDLKYVIAFHKFKSIAKLVTAWEEQFYLNYA